MAFSIPTVDVNQTCAERLGQQLNTERLARGLSIDDISDALLCSKGQVTGLESAELTSFYSSRLYAQLARKYCNFLAIDFPDSELLNDTLLVGEVAHNTPIVEAPKSVLPKFPSAPKLLRLPKLSKQLVPSLRLVFGALLAAAIAVAVFLKLTAPEEQPAAPNVAKAPGSEEAKAQPEESAPTPSVQEPAKPDAVATPPAPTTDKPSAPITEGAKQGVSLVLTGPSWINVSYSDGRQTQQNYKKGEQLNIDTKGAQAIVIGNANAVEMSVNGQPASLQAYRKPDSNVARIIGSQLRALLK